MLSKRKHTGKHSRKKTGLIKHIIDKLAKIHIFEQEFIVLLNISSYQERLREQARGRRSNRPELSGALGAKSCLQLGEKMR